MAARLSEFRDEVASTAADRDVQSFVAAYFLLFLVVDAYGWAIPLYYRAVGIPVAALGVAKGVGNALEALASAPLGVLADEYDRAALATVAGAALGCLLFAVPLATGPVVLGGLVVGLALARLAFGLATTPLVDETLPEGSEGLGWGLRDVGIYLGGAAGLGLAGVAVGGTASVGAAFPVLVPFVALMVGVVWRIHGPTFGDLPAPRDLLPEWPPRPLAAVRAVSRPGVLARILAADALLALGSGLGLFLVPVLAVDLGVRAEGFLLAFGGSHLVAAPLSVLGGAATDRLPRKHLYVGNFAAEAATLAAFALATGPLGVGLGIAAFVVQTGFEPAVLAYFFDQFGDDESGRAWGVDGTVTRGVGVVAPALGGYLYGVDPHLPFAVGATLVAGGGAVAATLPR